MGDTCKLLEGTFAQFLQGALLAAYQPASGNESTDQCAWYFLNFVVDTLLGTMIAFLLHRAFIVLARKLRWTRVMNSGDYGSPPSLCTLALQILSWELVIGLTKACVALGFLAAYKPLGRLAAAFGKPFEGQPAFELTFVMIVCPCVLNVIQFWIFDSILMSGKPQHAPSNRMDEGLMPVMQVPSDAYVAFELMSDGGLNPPTSSREMPSKSPHNSEVSYVEWGANDVGGEGDDDGAAEPNSLTSSIDYPRSPET